MELVSSSSLRLGDVALAPSSRAEPAESVADERASEERALVERAQQGDSRAIDLARVHSTIAPPN